MLGPVSGPGLRQKPLPEKGSKGQGAEHMVPEYGQRMRKTDELRPLQRLQLPVIGEPGTFLGLRVWRTWEEWFHVLGMLTW